MNPLDKLLKWKEDSAEHLKTGDWGETRAARLLKAKGYRILGRNVRVGTRDEVDLVARDKNILVFVEVKTRRRVDFGRPIAAVNAKKKHVLSRAAVRYLKKLGFPPVCIRFDVVEVTGAPDTGESDINHVENAFQLDRRYTLP